MKCQKCQDEHAECEPSVIGRTCVRCKTMKRRCVPVVTPAQLEARFAEMKTRLSSMRNQINHLLRLVTELQAGIGAFLEDIMSGVPNV